MWQCPKCQCDVEDSFEICWSCGTTRDGVEDPDFVTADAADPIVDGDEEDGPKPADDALAGDELADFGGVPYPDLVECYMASNPIEAKFIADRLMEEGIPAIADRMDINMVMGGFQPLMWGYGPKVRIRREDLGRAQTWLEAYEQRRKSKDDDLS